MTRIKIEEMHDALTEIKALKMVLSKSVPFATARLLFALNTIAMGYASSQLGKDEVAAAASFTSLQYLFVGAAQGLLFGSGMIFSEKYGEKQYAKIGKISRSTWIAALLAAAASIGLMLGAPRIMSAAHMLDSNVAKYTQEYLDFYAIAVPAVLLSVADQQLAVATKDPHVTLGFTAIYSLIASGIGIPATLGKLGDGLSGIKGFGMSTALSAWLGLLAMRIYFYASKKYHSYDLFSLDMMDVKKYCCELMSIGWKTSLQAGAEFANLTATASLLSAYGKHKNIPALQIMSPSIQIASAWGLVCIGLGQAQANLIAAERGAMRAAIDRADEESAENAKNNITKIARQGLIVGSALSLTLAIICIVAPSYLAKIFLYDGMSDADFNQSTKLIQYSALGLVFDMLRNVSAGSLKGFKDVNYATVVSFLTMTVLFAGIGAALLFEKDSIEGFAWLRNGLIGLASCFTAYRFSVFDKKSVQEQATPVRHSNAANRFAFHNVSTPLLNGADSNLNIQTVSASM